MARQGYFSIHGVFCLFVCPEVEMVILRTDPPLMLECGRSNIEEFAVQQVELPIQKLKTKRAGQMIF